MSSSSSSVAQPEKCNDINLAVVESKEKAMENNNSGLASDFQEVTSERRSENPSDLGSGAVPTGNGMVQRYTSELNKLYTCRFCNKLFSNSQGLGGHMNSHRREVELEKKRKEMEQDDHLQWILNQISQYALSNDNNLGITSGPFKRRCTGLYPSFNNGVMDMNMTVGPRMAPTRFFTGNPFTNGSYSGELGLVPPYNSYPPVFPGIPPSPTFGTTNLPTYLYPQENVLNEEDVILKLGNDKIVETDDDDEDADEEEEVTSKSWGADLSLSL